MSLPSSTRGSIIADSSLSAASSLSASESAAVTADPQFPPSNPIPHSPSLPSLASCRSLTVTGESNESALPPIKMFSRSSLNSPAIPLSPSIIPVLPLSQLQFMASNSLENNSLIDRPQTPHKSVGGAVSQPRSLASTASPSPIATPIARSPSASPRPAAVSQLASLNNSSAFQLNNSLSSLPTAARPARKLASLSISSTSQSSFSHLPISMSSTAHSSTVSTADPSQVTSPVGTPQRFSIIDSSPNSIAIALGRSESRNSNDELVSMTLPSSEDPPSDRLRIHRKSLSSSSAQSASEQPSIVTRSHSHSVSVPPKTSDIAAAINVAFGEGSFSSQSPTSSNTSQPAPHDSQSCSPLHSQHSPHSLSNLSTDNDQRTLYSSKDSQMNRSPRLSGSSFRHRSSSVGDSQSLSFKLSAADTTAVDPIRSISHPTHHRSPQLNPANSQPVSRRFSLRLTSLNTAFEGLREQSEPQPISLTISEPAKSTVANSSSPAVITDWPTLHAIPLSTQTHSLKLPSRRASMSNENFASLNLSTATVLNSLSANAADHSSNHRNAPPVLFPTQDSSFSPGSHCRSPPNKGRLHQSLSIQLNRSNTTGMNYSPIASNSSINNNYDSGSPPILSNPQFKNVKVQKLLGMTEVEFQANSMAMNIRNSSLPSLVPHLALEFPAAANFPTSASFNSLPDSINSSNANSIPPSPTPMPHSLSNTMSELFCLNQFNTNESTMKSSNNANNNNNNFNQQNQRTKLNSNTNQRVSSPPPQSSLPLASESTESDAIVSQDEISFE